MEKKSEFSLTGIADRAGIWWGIFGPNGLVWFLTAAGVGVIMAFFEPISAYGWAGIALAALFASALLLLLLAVGAAVAAWAWRKYRPLDANGNTNATPLVSQDGSELGIDNLRNSLASLQADLGELKDAVALAAGAPAIQRAVSGIEAALESRTKRIEEIRLAAKDGHIHPPGALLGFEDECRQLANSIGAEWQKDNPAAGTPDTFGMLDDRARQHFIELWTQYDVVRKKTIPVLEQGRLKPKRAQRAQEQSVRLNHD